MYSLGRTLRGIWVMACIESCVLVCFTKYRRFYSGEWSINVKCPVFDAVVFSSIIWYKASLAWAQKAQQLKYSCQESREGKYIHGFNPCSDTETNVATLTLGSFQPAVRCDCIMFDAYLWLAIDSKTHRFSPSQCVLAAASNPLHLPLVHGAGEAASLVWAIPSLTASHMNRPKPHHHPSQQNLSQLPRSHRSAIPPTESLLC